MKIRIVLAAVAAVSLASAAHAQTVSGSRPAPSSMPMTAPPAEPAAGIQTKTTTEMAPPAAVANGMDASAVVTTTVVSNGPIADTPENRAKYGQPMSNAGKRSKAQGN